MRKSLSLLVATAAVAGSIFMASPAQAWTCAINDKYVPQEVGETVCDVFLTAVGTACRVLPFPCVG